MKNLLLLFVALFLSVTGFAQSAQEEVDLIQSLYGMQKKEIVYVPNVKQAFYENKGWKIIQKTGDG